MLILVVQLSSTHYIVIPDMLFRYHVLLITLLYHYYLLYTLSTYYKKKWKKLYELSENKDQYC